MSARIDYYEARRMERIRAQLAAGKTVTLRRLGRGRLERNDAGQFCPVMTVHIPAGFLRPGEAFAATTIRDASSAALFVSIAQGGAA